LVSAKIREVSFEKGAKALEASLANDTRSEKRSSSSSSRVEEKSMANSSKVEEWSSANRTNLSRLCLRVDYEYGNEAKGACTNAPLVALHCKEACMRNVRDQPWFPAFVGTREVEYTSPERCHQACEKTEGCEFWVFDTREGDYQNACWMKESVKCEVGYADSPGFVSGPKQCKMGTIDDSSSRQTTMRTLVAAPTGQRRSPTSAISEVHEMASVHEVRQAASKHEAKSKQGAKSIWAVWLWPFVMFGMQTIGGGMCMAGVARLVYSKSKMADQENLIGRAIGSPSEIPQRYIPRSYKTQGHPDQIPREQLAETLRGFSPPPPAGPCAGASPDSPKEFPEETIEHKT
jgi:hypothetical protein